MRLSRPRVVLRIVLLVVGGVFMLVRARQLHGAAAGDATGALVTRLALVWALMGVLALVTAAATTWSLLRRPRRQTLHLDDPRGPGKDR